MSTVWIWVATQTEGGRTPLGPKQRLAPAIGGHAAGVLHGLRAFAAPLAVGCGRRGRPQAFQESVRSGTIPIAERATTGDG
jgi:hypothetical protein